MFQPVRTDPPADLVRRITFVPFLADGRCVLIDEPDGPALPSGEVLDGEDYLLDTVLRVPLQTAGFGFRCAGQTSGGDRPGRPPAPTAWITADPAP